MNIKHFALGALLTIPAIAPLAAQAAPTQIAAGTFVTGAHDTKGTATIYKLDDGSRVLRLTDFSTSNGPKVHVLLADHVVTGNDVENDKAVDLGDLKGTTGNQNYTIPASVELSNVKAVSIWCERFKVNFGAATLK